MRVIYLLFGYALVLATFFYLTTEIEKAAGTVLAVICFSTSEILTAIEKKYARN